MTSTETNENEEVRVNFADVDDPQEFELLPNGKYDFEVNDLDETTVQNGPNEGCRVLKWEFITLESTEKYPNRKVWERMTLSRKSLPNVKGLLVALGYDPQNLSYDFSEQEFYYKDEDGDTVQLDMSELVGEKFTGKVTKRRGNKGADGTEYPDRNSISKYEPYEASEDDLMP